METYYLKEDLYKRLLDVRDFGLCEFRELDLELVSMGLVEFVVSGGLECVRCTEDAELGYIDLAMDEYVGLVG